MDDEGNIIKLFDNVMNHTYNIELLIINFTSQLPKASVRKLSKDGHLLMLKYPFKHGETTNQVMCITSEVY